MKILHMSQTSSNTWNTHWQKGVQTLSELIISELNQFSPWTKRWSVRDADRRITIYFKLRFPEPPVPVKFEVAFLQLQAPQCWSEPAHSRILPKRDYSSLEFSRLKFVLKVVWFVMAYNRAVDTLSVVSRPNFFGRTRSVLEPMSDDPRPEGR